MRIRFALALAFCAPAAAADVLTVGPPGSGADFADLPLAVEAAQSGDQIRLLPGSYATTSITKGLEIIGSGSDQTTILGTNPFAPTMSVVGLPQAERVHFSGLEFRGASLFLAPFSVLVRDCEGTVTFDGCLLSAETATNRSGALEVTNSALVLVSDSELSGADLSLVFSGTSSTLPAVRVTDSTLALERSTVQGSTSSPAVTGTSAGDVRGGDGVLALGSTVVIANSELRGGIGGTFNLVPGFTGPGGAGLNLVGGVAVLGGDSRLVGADGVSFEGSNGAGGAGLIVQSAASVQAGPDVVFEGGQDALTPTFGPDTVVSPAAEFELLAERFVTLAAVNDAGAGLASVDVTVTGEPGRTALLFADLGAAPASFLPFVSGPLVLDPLSAVEVTTQVLPAGGVLQVPVSTTAPAAELGKPVVFQAIEIDPLTGLLRASLPAGTTIEF